MRSRSIHTRVHTGVRAGLRVCLVLALAAAMPACGKKKEKQPVQKPAPAEPGAKLRQPKPRSDRDSLADVAFLVKISLTRGTTGPHADATQVNISVIDDKLYYVETPYDDGRKASKASPRITLVAALTADDKKAITQSLRDLSLFDVESIKAPKMPDGPHSYAAISVKLRAGGKAHEFALSGVTSLPDEGKTAFATTAGYRAVMRLVDDLSALAKEKGASARASAPK